MGKDQYYDEIEQRLGGRLDPLVFEECCIDLLHGLYPSITHVPGGSDGGMDGAIADGEGEPFPLVCTTSTDVIGNLTKSLNRMISERNPRRKVILATSDSLTARRRANLFKRARQKGFVLLGVHQRSDIARLLYHEPAWCKTLLDLAGNLPALSVLPPRGSFIVPSRLIGRENEADWLTEQQGDCVVVGQPGLGKTSLLRQFAQRNGALFVVDENPDRITDEVRAKSPTCVILDDAGQSRKLCSDLRLIREHIGAKYRIVASCWPTDMDQVLRELCLCSDAALELEPLSSGEILEILKQAGLRGRSRLFRELVDQSRGRPGLAFTLARACLEGSSADVWRGDLLKRHLLIPLENAGIRESAAEVLAVIALSGERGIMMEEVASLAGIDAFQVRNLLSRVGHSGILDVFSSGAVGVSPVAMRHVLVRDTFINSSLPRNLADAIEKIGDRERALLTVIGAVARGGRLDPPQLGNLVRNCTSSRVWCAFAYLSRDYGEYAVEANPRVVDSCSRELLVSAPEVTIPLLLARAVGDARPLNSATEHPLRIISDWIGDAGQGRDAIRRRSLLADATEEWSHNGGCDEVSLRSLAIALSPAYEFHDSDPLNDLAGTLTWGYLGRDDLRILAKLGVEKLRSLSSLDIEDWTPLLDCLQAWVHPLLNSTPPEDWLQAQVDGAKSLVVACAEHLAARPGAMRSIVSLAEDVEVHLKINRNTEFDVLYPSASRDTDNTVIERQRVAVEKLADAWLALEPSEVAKKLCAYSLEAQSAGHVWPCWTPFLCARLARETPSVTEWISAFVLHELGTGHLEPFLGRLLEDKPDGYEVVLKEVVDHPDLVWDCIAAVLKSSSAEQLLPIVRDAIGQFGDGIRSLVLRQDVDSGALPLLLEHEEESIREATASALWSAHDHSIPGEIYPIWAQSILTLRKGVWFLEAVFAGNSRLAFEWLQHVVEEPPSRIGRMPDALASAVSVLNRDQRSAVIASLDGPRWLCWELSSLIVQKDQDLYEQLLSRQHLEYCWSAPLESFPDQVWLVLASRALDAGCSEEEIVTSCLRWLQRAEIECDSPDKAQHFTESVAELVSSAAPELRSVLGKLSASAEQ